MEQKNHVPGIRGVVADIIHVEKNYEIAIETALGGSIQNIVTDNEQTAKQMIEFLKKNRYGRATFLPLNSISSRGEFNQRGALNEPGAIGLASGLVTAEKEYDGLIGYLLGRVLVVDHIDHAIAIARKYRHSIRMVTLEGESLSPGGSMTGGAFKNNSNLLGRRREIEELEGKVVALKEELQKIQKVILDKRERRNALRDELTEMTRQLQQLQIGQNTEKVGITQAEARIREVRTGYGQLKAEGREIENQIAEIKGSSSSIREEMEQSTTREQEQEALVNSHQEILEQLQEKEAAYSQELNQIQLDYASLEQKVSFAGENLSRIHQEEATMREELQQMQEALEAGGKGKRRKRTGYSDDSADDSGSRADPRGR